MRFLREGEAGAKAARGARGGSSTRKGSWGVRSLAGRRVSMQAPLLPWVLCLPPPPKAQGRPCHLCSRGRVDLQPHRRRRGCGCSGISLACSGLGGPLSREWESWPERGQGHEGLVPCDTRQCPLTWGACPGQGERHGGSGRGPGAGVGLHTQQLSPGPAGSVASPAAQALAGTHVMESRETLVPPPEARLKVAVAWWWLACHSVRSDGLAAADLHLTWSVRSRRGLPPAPRPL